MTDKGLARGRIGKPLIRDFTPRFAILGEIVLASLDRRNGLPHLTWDYLREQIMMCSVVPLRKQLHEPRKLFRVFRDNHR